MEKCKEGRFKAQLLKRGSALMVVMLFLFVSCQTDEDEPTDTNVWLADERLTATGGNEVELYGFTNSYAADETIWVTGNTLLVEQVGPLGEAAQSDRATFFFKKPMMKVPLDHPKYLFEIGYTSTGSFIQFIFRSNWTQVFSSQFRLKEIDPENTSGNLRATHYSKGESLKANGSFLLVPNGNDISIFKFTEKWIGSFLNGFDVSIISRVAVSDYDRLDVIDGYFFVSGENQTFRADTLGNVVKVSDQSLVVFKNGDTYHGLTTGTASSEEYTSDNEGIDWDHYTDHENFRADSVQFSRVDDKLIAYKPKGIYLYSPGTSDADFIPLRTKGILKTEDISSLREFGNANVFITTFPRVLQSFSHCYYKTTEQFFELP